MFIETVPNRNSPPAVLLRESYRDEHGRAQKRTLANLSKLPRDVVDALRALLKGGTVIGTGPDELGIERSLPHGHVAAALGMIRKIALDRLILSTAKDAASRRHCDLVVAMIVDRLIAPRSKLGFVRAVDAETAATSLGALRPLGGSPWPEIEGPADARNLVWRAQPELSEKRMPTCAELADVQKPAVVPAELPPFKGFGIQHSARIAGERDVHGQHVRAPQQLIQADRLAAALSDADADADNEALADAFNAADSATTAPGADRLMPKAACTASTSPEICTTGSRAASSAMRSGMRRLSSAALAFREPMYADSVACSEAIAEADNDAVRLTPNAACSDALRLAISEALADSDALADRLAAKVGMPADMLMAAIRFSGIGGSCRLGTVGSESRNDARRSEHRQGMVMAASRNPLDAGPGRFPSHAGGIIVMAPLHGSAQRAGPLTLWPGVKHARVASAIPAVSLQTPVGPRLHGASTPGGASDRTIQHRLEASCPA